MVFFKMANTQRRNIKENLLQITNLLLDLYNYKVIFVFFRIAVGKLG